MGSEGYQCVAENLMFSYGGIPALKNVSFVIEPGSVTGVFGHNGAGKSTLLKVLSGLLEPEAGLVKIDGISPHALGVTQLRRLGIAYVRQQKGVFDELEVRENLDLATLATGNKGASSEAIQEVYQRFPVLASKRRSKAKELSGGERQMLGLACALVVRPRLLMLDEPTLGLATGVTERLLESIGGLKRGGGCTIIIVEHKIEMFLPVCTGALVLKRGVASYHGPALALKDRQLFFNVFV